MADDKKNQKKDLTRLEDMSEFLHQLQSDTDAALEVGKKVGEKTESFTIPKEISNKYWQQSNIICYIADGGLVSAACKGILPEREGASSRLRDEARDNKARGRGDQWTVDNG